jgi:hypothetical protein
MRCAAPRAHGGDPQAGGAPQIVGRSAVRVRAFLPAPGPGHGVGWQAGQGEVAFLPADGHADHADDPEQRCRRRAGRWRRVRSGRPWQFSFHWSRAAGAEEGQHVAGENSGRAASPRVLAAFLTGAAGLGGGARAIWSRPARRRKSATRGFMSSWWISGCIAVSSVTWCVVVPRMLTAGALPLCWGCSAGVAARQEAECGRAPARGA